MATSAFSSVKLPGSLVEKARQAARPMRRSVASQIEYWATLGQALERSGLSTEDSRVLITREESPAYRLADADAGAAGLSPELSALHDHVLALAQSGALAARATAAVDESRAKAAPANRARKTA